MITSVKRYLQITPKQRKNRNMRNKHTVNYLKSKKRKIDRQYVANILVNMSIQSKLA